MLHFILQQQLDVTAYALLVIALVLYADVRYLRRSAHAARRWLTICLTPLLALLGLYGSQIVCEYQRTHLRLSIEGLAPTYASEMAQLGHEQIGWDTPADDPLYLTLIERQKRWLTFNKAIADVYTMRPTADQQLALLVDSETDYNDNGHFDGRRESRTQIGEVYANAPPAMWDALSGRTVFDDNPLGDRWGVWVSAYTPVFADDGHVDAILGVDFTAADWVLILLMSRCGVLGLALSVIFGFVVQSCARIVQWNELENHRKVAETHRQQSLMIEDALRRLESYQFALNSHAILLVTDAKGTVTFANDHLCRVSGYSRQELLGDRPHLMNSGHHSRAFWRDMWRTISSGTVWNGEVCNRRKNGSIFWVENTIVPYRDATNQITQYITIGTDITARKKFEIDLIKAARLDQLTGLPNRALVHDRLQQMIARSHRNSAYGFAVMFLDFDRFKLINDSLGHDVGDMLLKEIAGRLKKHLRSTDSVSAEVTGTTIARLGGDEFVVLVDSIQRPLDAAVIADRLLHVCGEAYIVGGQTVKSSVSIGIVCSHPRYLTADEMLRDADIAMYQAKARGKAQHVIFDASMQQAVRERLQIENDLRTALAEGQFFLQYQPIVSLDDGSLCSVEALTRWNHPVRGVVSPMQFISIAEETRLILPLSLWILEEACRQFMEWQRTDPQRAPGYISVNLSRIHLSEASLVEQVIKIVRESGMQPAQLQLEVTESEIMQDRDSAVAMLNALKAEGIRLAMDDFGTGYSSLACLHEFPFDVLKIDRAFIANLDQGRAFIVLANSIVSLAENLGMQCVAEGIESLDQIAVLQAMGCSCGQGYYFGKAVPADVLISGNWNPGSTDLPSPAELSLHDDSQVAGW